MTANNPKDQGRREVLKGALSIGGIAAGISTTSNLLFPALAQGERLIPFTDEASEAFPGDQSSLIRLIGRIPER